MATLVLTAVGTAIGGPFGAALGGAIGRSIDQQLLFRSRGREGPRLADLAVQTSTYGSIVPRVYGRARVPGTVIWATDLKETRSRQGGGKGRPSTTSYSYSVSLAVAVSSRPVTRIGRIWAEGNLLRGLAGDFKVSTGFRFHAGHDDQPADPLIAMAEGAARAPAHRGLAYAVFEDLQLAEFGNRIPSLSFEVIAEEAPVFLADLLADAGGVTLAGSTGEAIDGAVLSEGDRAGALETLSTLYPLVVDDAPAGLVARLAEAPGAGGAPLVLPAAALLATSADDRDDNGAGAARDRDAERQAGPVALRYYDPARDYQPGLRRARLGLPDAAAQSVECPVVIDAGVAQRRADLLALLARGIRHRLRLRVAALEAGLRPGATLLVEGEPGAWRVTGWRLDADGLALDLEGVPTEPSLLTLAGPGRSVSAPDALLGETRFRLLDLPSEFDLPATAPRVGVALAGVSSGWRGATLFRDLGEGALGPALLSVRQPTVMGVVTVPPGAGSPLVFNAQGALTVQLFGKTGEALVSANPEALLAGENLAMVGEEALQFADVEPLGGGVYRLSGLLRGRGGTEDRIGGHAVGEAFALIDERLTILPAGLATPGLPLTLAAQGLGDAVPRLASLTAPLRALRPLSPVHGKASIAGDGGLWLGWVARSRTGFGWRSGVDLFPDEPDQRFRVTLGAGGAPLYQTETTDTALIIAGPTVAAARSAAGSTPLAATIEQLGRYAPSPPLLVGLG